MRASPVLYQVYIALLELYGPYHLLSESEKTTLELMYGCHLLVLVGAKFFLTAEAEYQQPFVLGGFANHQDIILRLLGFA